MTTITLTLDSAMLKKACALAGTVIVKRSKLEAPSCVHLKADEHDILIEGTDLVRWVQVRYPNASLDASACDLILPFEFLQMVRIANSDTIALEIEDTGSVKMRAGTNQWKMRTLPHAEYPDMPALGGDMQESTLECATLVAGLRSVAYAVGSDDTRPALTGVLWSEAELVATDTHKLAVRNLESAGSVLLPSEAAAWIMHHVEGGTVQCYKSASAALRLTWESAGLACTFESRLLARQYPNFRSVIPEGWQARLTLDRAALQNALQAVGIAAHPYGKILCAYDPATAMLNIEMDGGHQVGKAIVECAMAGSPDKKVQWAWSGNYATHTLGAMRGTQVQIDWQEPLRPLVLTDPASADWLALVMPMSL